MKKSLLIISVAVLILATGCKKSALVPLPSTAPVLLDHYVLKYTGGADSTNFTYDSANRIIEKKSVNYDYTFKYDSQGRLIEENDYNSFLPSHIVQYLNAFNTNNTGTSTLVVKNNTTVTSTQVRTTIYDPNGNIINLDAGANFNNYTYDSNGNLATETSYSATVPVLLRNKTEYTYDQQKSSLSNVPGHSLNNNPVLIKTTYYVTVNSVPAVSTSTYTYQYNTNGFPVSSTRVDIDGENGNRVTTSKYTYYYNQ